MAAKKQAAKARSAAEGASPYVQRVIEDAELRENVRVAIENAKKAYGRLTNGKPATKVLDDKKLHKEVKQAAESLRDAVDLHVVRHHDHDLIARADQRHHREEVRFARAGGHEHVARIAA